MGGGQTSSSGSPGWGWGGSNGTRVSEVPGEDAVLADLKFICSIASRYPRNPKPQKREVDRRADGLTAEYARKARSVDTQYGGVPQGVEGPALQRLQSYGRICRYVVGHSGEMSEDLHILIHYIVKCRLQGTELLHAHQGLSGRGRQLSAAGEMAIIISSLRRQLSFLAVMFAQAVSLWQGRQITRRGQFKLDRGPPNTSYRKISMDTCPMNKDPLWKIRTLFEVLNCTLSGDGEF